MSLSLMIQAFKTKVNNPVRKLILIKLADNANDLGECWPSHQHIADQCEVSKRTVIYHIKALEESGLIHKENRFKNNEQQSNMYTLFPSGANNSPTGCSKNTHGVQDIHPRGADNSRGTGAESAHRTNHSFESSNEPSIEPKEVNSDKPSLGRFEEFWTTYPKERRINKKRCLATWTKQGLDSKADLIIERLKNQVAKQYQHTEARYIPHALTYLNGERWEDEVTEIKPPKPKLRDLSNMNYEPNKPEDYQF